MHTHQDVPGGGRWVPTVADDIRAGDTVRRNGAERYVIGRTETPRS